MAEIIGAPTLDDALAALGERAARNEACGKKNLIFCEDRLTLLAEGAVLDAVGGSFLTDVTTFSRFLSGNCTVLSKQGSVMAISDILAENREKLHYFRPGAARAVYETIAQLSASCVEPELLRRSAEETEGVLRGKLFDLALICEAYRDFLIKKGLRDETGYLAGLPDTIRRSDLRDTHVFFFAFPSFTRQAREGIRAALDCAADVTGIFLAGEKDFYTNEAAHLFRKVCEEKEMPRLGMKKSSLSGEARLFAERLFAPERFSLARKKVEHIRTFTAADEGEEIASVACLIKRYVVAGVRYREIAVLVPDKKSFITVEKVFSAYRIPFFADRRRAFSEHPFCRLLLTVLRGCASGVLPEEADGIAANVYFGKADQYRNYLMRFGGYRGAIRREIKEGDAVKGYDRELLVVCRQRMLDALALFPKGQSKEFAEVCTRGVRELYRLCDGEHVTQELQRKCSAPEREFLEISPLEQILSEIETVVGSRRVTAKEFSEMLENGLDALERSMIPQYADAVFVGDATDSRFSRVKILFATGMTDALPLVAADTAVITDGEIGRLSGLNVEISPAMAQVNARARESLALNLCSFTQELYMSYPLRRTGEEMRCSEAVTYAQQLFCMPPIPDPFPFDSCEREPAFLCLLEMKQTFEAGENDPVFSVRYASLYSALCRRGEKKRIDRLLGAGVKAKVPSAASLYFSDRVSPTLLEEYFACPYRGFALRGLKLREREEKTVLNTDAGTFVHAVLQQCAARFNEMRSAEECRSYARKCGEALLSSSAYMALADTDAGVYTGARLIEEGESVSVAAYLQLASSDFRVNGTETAVFLDELSLKGTVDRVDLSTDKKYVRVIDYKTGSFDGTPTAYYTGRKLQLELYLKAAAEGAKPAGTFYFPAADRIVGPEENKFRMIGFFSGEEEVLSRMDLTLKEGEKSLVFEAKRDGKFSDKGMSQRDFEDFLDYGILVSKGAEKEMRAGNIAPLPYGESCKYCKLNSLCGFVGEPRKADAVRCADIVQIVRRTKGEI